MKQTQITDSFEETQQLGFDFAEQAQDLQVIALHGYLGSGKTTFVQGLAKGFGIKRNIISPTFIIMRTYKIDGSGKKKFFYHVDLYRINDQRDIDGLGLPELLEDPQNIVVIEWPEKIEKLLPEKKMELFFEYVGDDKRKIVVNPE
jgi:tRNA threonylcarbamoyladenosine biosynthesis protein TsaE